VLALALAALRSRRAQSLAFMLLTCLVIGGVVGTPYYLLASADGVVERDQFNVPADQSQVALSQQIESSGGVGLGIGPRVDSALDAMNQLMTGRNLARTTTLTTLQPLSSENSSIRLNAAVAYSSGVCDRVTLRGACPGADGEVMVSEDDAAKLKVNLGDTIPFTGSFVKPLPQLKVVGIYKPSDPQNPSWGGILLAANQPNGSSTTGDAAFLTLDSFKRLAPEAYLTQTVFLPVGHLSQLQVHNFDQAIAEAQFVGPRNGVGVSSGFGTVVDHINADVNQLLFTVPVLAVETIFLGWFALFLVVRANASNRQAETGLLRLRGVPRSTQWGQSSAQTVLPAIVAAPFGAVLGILGARALAGPVPTDERWLAAAIAAGAGLIVVLGVAFAAVAASRRGRGGPILEMLRDTPPRRRGWRSDALDVIVLVLAIAAIVQSHQPHAQGGLILVAPALTALAVALVMARLIAPVSARMVPRAIRSGSVTGLLTATHLARRPGIDRIFTLLVVVVSLVANALLGWSVAIRAQDARARQEVGANRVLTVNKTTPGQLLAATRKIDPSGKYAMAVSYFHDSEDDALAVDSSRLSAIFPAGLPGAPGLTGAELARLLHPSPVSGFDVNGNTIAVQVDAKVFGKGDKGATFYLIVEMLRPDGTLLRTPLGPLTVGAHTYQAGLDGCDPTCSVLGLFPAEVGRGAEDVVLSAVPVRAGSELVVQTINGKSPGPSVNWRGSLDPAVIGPVLADSAAGLDISLPGESYNGLTVNSHIYPAATPAALPAVYSGDLPPQLLGGVSTSSTFGDIKMPVAFTRKIAAMPRLGEVGSMVDLQYANYLNATSTNFATLQVWLGKDAPSDIVAKLGAAGVGVVSSQTMSAAVTSYRADSSEAARRYALLGAALGLALGIIALLLVGAGERKARATEFAALRVQGIPDRNMRHAVVISYTLLAALAIVVGLLATILGRALASGQLRVFTDNWNILAMPSSWWLPGWLIVLAAAVLPLMVTAAIVGRALRRDVSRRLKVAKQ